MKQKIDLKSLLLGILIAAIVLFSVSAATSNKSPDVLRVRKLVIVDDKGAERIVLAAPLADPQITGKRVPRRSPATGVQSMTLAATSAVASPCSMTAHSWSGSTTE